MMQKIQNSQRFKEDYSNFQKKITDISDTEKQNELNKLLAEFKNTVIYIDRCHEQMFINGKINSEVSELRQDLIKIKSQLEQKLANYRSTSIMPELHPNAE